MCTLQECRGYLPNQTQPKAHQNRFKLTDHSTYNAFKSCEISSRCYGNASTRTREHDQVSPTTWHNAFNRMSHNETNRFRHEMLFGREPPELLGLDLSSDFVRKSAIELEKAHRNANTSSRKIRFTQRESTRSKDKQGSRSNSTEQAISNPKSVC